VQSVFAVVRTSAFLLACSGHFIRYVGGRGASREVTMFGLLQVMGSFQLTSGPPSPLYKVRQDKVNIKIIGFGSALVERKRRRKARVSDKQTNGHHIEKTKFTITTLHGIDDGLPSLCRASLRASNRI
jgi:hypothetical protein